MERRKEIKSSGLELIISCDAYRYFFFFSIIIFLSFFVKVGKANILCTFEASETVCADKIMNRKIK